MPQNDKMVKKQITKKTKNLTIKEGTEIAGVYKEEEFQKFVLWLSLPRLLKGKSDEYLGQLGIEDEEQIELLQITNLTQFAEKYNLEPSTLSGWKKKARELGLLEVSKDFYRGLTKNVYHAFYFETLKNGDAARVRLWLEEVAGKIPEAPPIVTNNILTPQFSQVINSLKVEYKEKLRTYYGEQIKKSDEVRSPERVRTDRPNK